MTTLLLMIFGPLFIPLFFALTPVVFAVLLHLEARGERLRQSRYSPRAG